MTNKQNIYFLPAATDSFAEIGVQGDTVARSILGADGKISMGPGGLSAVDTNLYRNSAGELKTDGALTVTGTLTPTAGTKSVLTALSSDGIAANSGISTFGTTTAASYTLAAPVAGKHVELYCTAGSSINTQTFTTTGAGINNSTTNKAAFTALANCLHLVGLSTSLWGVIANTGSVAISS